MYFSYRFVADCSGMISFSFSKFRPITNSQKFAFRVSAGNMKNSLVNKQTVHTDLFWNKYINDNICKILRYRLKQTNTSALFFSETESRVLLLDESIKCKADQRGQC